MRFYIFFYYLLYHYLELQLLIIIYYIFIERNSYYERYPDETMGQYT